MSSIFNLSTSITDTLNPTAVYCPSLLIVQLAIDYGIKFLETSAKSSINVEEVRHQQTNSSTVQSETQ